jgi:hypothetical protein
MTDYLLEEQETDRMADEIGLPDAVEAVKRVADRLDETTFAWCQGCGYFHCGERCEGICSEASSTSVTTDIQPRIQT